MKTINLRILGMHCSSCEMLIRDGLEELDGVKDVQVSHKTGSATLVFDESKINENAIKSAIATEGFEVA
ncbi:TPA: heavy-metal-associated domain-containing protein [Candidatus Woesearchaeota archaeon]|nr:heavy-metal-associated domain-containing protein [Candidatus Woesearchaeota archaeon]